MKKLIKLRPHHLICLSRSYSKRGGWYNQKLFRYANKICLIFENKPELKIRIVKKCDDLCKKCPNIKKGICEKRLKINYWIIVMDNKVLKKLKIKENSTYKIKYLFKRVLQNISNKDLKDICYGCESLPYCLKEGLNKKIVFITKKEKLR
ncbi:MAG: DUF1284 domain-containing protein [Candidatus Pacearchaeota archaeon]|nr:DUF1284 domain-containing protein [Candidatus Pacearchaeota archaeon]